MGSLFCVYELVVSSAPFARKVGRYGCGLAVGLGWFADGLVEYGENAPAALIGSREERESSGVRRRIGLSSSSRSRGQKRGGGVMELTGQCADLETVVPVSLTVLDGAKSTGSRSEA